MKGKSTIIFLIIVFFSAIFTMFVYGYTGELGVTIITSFLVVLIVSDIITNDVFNSENYIILGKKNKNLKDAINYSVELFDSCNNRLNMVAGELDTRFYNNEKILKSFEKMVDRNVKISIICGHENEASKCETLSKLIEDKKIELHLLKDRPKNHFMVGDKSFIRIEMPHKPLEGVRKAFFVYDEILGNELDNRFNKFLKPLE